MHLFSATLAMLGDPSEKTDGVASPSKDIVIQVEEAEVENKRRTRFADEEPTPEQQKKAAANAAKKAKVWHFLQIHIVVFKF